MKSSQRLLGLVLSTSLLSGCGGLHLYDAQKDAIAKEAKNSFLEANLPDLAKQEYILNQQTLDQQLIVVRKHTLTLRDAILAEVLDRQEDACPAPGGTATPSSPNECKADDRRSKGNLTWGFLERTITQRLGKELGIQRAQDALAVLELMRDIESADSRVAELEAGTRAVQDEDYVKAVLEPELKRQKKMRDQRQESIETFFNEKVPPQKEGDPLKFSPTGAFRRLFDEIKQLNAKGQEIKEKAKDAKSKFDSLKAEYDQAVQAGMSQMETDELVGILQQAEHVLAEFTAMEAALADSKADKKKAFDDAVAALRSTVEASKGDSNKTAGGALVQLAAELSIKKGEFEKKIREGYKAATEKGNTTAFAKQASYYLESGIEVFSDKKINGLNVQAVKDLAAAIEVPKIRTQMDAVNQLINVYADNNGTVPQAMDRPTETAVRVAQTLRSVSDHYATTKTFPHASGLLLESERLRIEYEAAKQRVARGETHIQLLSAKLKAMMHESRYLAMAKNEFEAAMKMMVAANKLDQDHTWVRHHTSLIEDHLAGDANLQLGIAKALYFYACSWTLGRVMEEEADYRMIALNHESALDSAVTALEQWNNLILVPLTGIAAFHGSGVTTDDIAKFFQAAGVGAIAGGVIK